MPTETTDAPPTLLALPDAPLAGTLQHVPTEQVPDTPGPIPGDLQKSVALNGVLQPVALVLDPEGTFHMGAGRRRRRAAGLCGHSTIPAIVFHAPSVREAQTLAAAIALIENLKRSDNPASELDAIERLARLSGVKEEDIAKHLGLSLQTVRKRLKLQTLRPELRAAFREGLMAPTVAESASGLSREQQGELLTALDERNKIVAADVATLRQATRAEALSMLPDDVFGGPDFATVVANHTGEGAPAAAAPADPWTALRAKIETAIAAIPKNSPQASLIEMRLDQALRLVPANTLLAA